MSGQMSEVEKRKRKMPCSTCGAAVGDPCKAKSGRMNSTGHVARFYMAWQRGLFPIRPGEGSQYD